MRRFLGGVVVGAVVGMGVAVVHRAWQSARESATNRAMDVLSETTGKLSDVLAAMVAAPPVTYEQHYENGNGQVGATVAPSIGARNAATVVGPVDELGGDDWEDPTNLDKDLDRLPEDIMAAGRLQAWYPQPLADVYPEPVPESEPLSDNRIASYAPGENPYSDIGLQPPQEPEL